MTFYEVFILGGKVKLDDKGRACGARIAHTRGFYLFFLVRLC